MLNEKLIRDIISIMIIVVTIIGGIRFKNICSIYYYIITWFFACLEITVLELLNTDLSVV